MSQLSTDLISIIIQYKGIFIAVILLTIGKIYLIIINKFINIIIYSSNIQKNILCRYYKKR